MATKIVEHAFHRNKITFFIVFRKVLLSFLNYLFAREMMSKAIHFNLLFTEIFSLSRSPRPREFTTSQICFPKFSLCYTIHSFFYKLFSIFSIYTARILLSTLAWEFFTTNNLIDYFIFFLRFLASASRLKFLVAAVLFYLIAHRCCFRLFYSIFPFVCAHLAPKQERIGWGCFFTVCSSLIAKKVLKIRLKIFAIYL